MRFDHQDGTLWVTGYSEGLARITTRSNGFDSKVYALPGRVEAMDRHPTLWVCIRKPEMFG